MWTHPFVHRVATSEIYNDSYADIRDRWSVGELVEALRHINHRHRLEEYHREKAEKKVKR